MKMRKMMKIARKAKTTRTLDEDRKENVRFHTVTVRLFIFQDILETSITGAKSMRGRQYQDSV